MCSVLGKFSWIKWSRMALFKCLPDGWQAGCSGETSAPSTYSASNELSFSSRPSQLSQVSELSVLRSRKREQALCVLAFFKPLLKSQLLMSLDQSKSHEQAHSQCERGLHKVIDTNQNEKTRDKLYHRRQLHIEVGLGFSEQGWRRIMLQGSTEFW